MYNVCILCLPANLFSDIVPVDVVLEFGGNFGSRRCLNITVVDDLVFESEESFDLIASVLSTNISTFISDSVVTIVDDDGKARNCG